MGTVRRNGSTRIEPAGCDCGAAHFTGRELEVLLEIASGKTSQAAAMALGIKPDTVNEHIGNMNAKAGVRKRAELIAMTIVQAIIVMEDGVVRWGGRACVRPRPGGRGTGGRADPFGGIMGQVRPAAPGVTCRIP
ncbi:MAG TPA: helix-turn-helix transcriptional regulator [Rugosimonospora sp.]|jgi:DNA-binding CsgD family transcriptional regulator